MKYLFGRINQKLIMKNITLVLTGRICPDYHFKLWYCRIYFNTKSYSSAILYLMCFHNFFFLNQKFIYL